MAVPEGIYDVNVNSNHPYLWVRHGARLIGKINPFLTMGG
jgi:hypothetical protein